MRGKRALFRGALAVVGLITLYLRALRPRMLSWGATPEEVRSELPGDDIVPHPRYVSTRAISIGAEPAEVWPWLAQLGQGRGGLYSYEWLENLFGCDIHNADQVLPDHQHVAVGDRIRLVPEDYKVDLAFDVARVDVDRALVLCATGTPSEAFEQGLPYPSWAFVILPDGPGRSRLVIRWRSDFEPTFAGYLWSEYGIEPVHFMMERKMLKGIKERAE
jgi:hypothetical protein